MFIVSHNTFSTFMLLAFCVNTLTIFLILVYNTVQYSLPLTLGDTHKISYNSHSKNSCYKFYFILLEIVYKLQVYRSSTSYEFDRLLESHIWLLSAFNECISRSILSCAECMDLSKNNLLQRLVENIYITLQSTCSSTENK